MANKKKKNKKRQDKFYIDTRDLWKPGVGIICKRCGIGVGDHFDGAQTLDEAVKKFLAHHTKESCNQMLEMNDEIEKNGCPYPCCQGNKVNGKKNKSKKK